MLLCYVVIKSVAMVPQLPTTPAYDIQSSEETIGTGTFNGVSNEALPLVTHNGYNDVSWYLYKQRIAIRGIRDSSSGIELENTGKLRLLCRKFLEINMYYIIRH